MRRPIIRTLAIGLFGGFALGVAARSWMRLISEKPEFSWSGTLAIVISFTAFGLAQSVVAVVRDRSQRPWKIAIARVAGGIFALPLFAAAGAAMFPTVLFGALGSARTTWHRFVRGLLFLLASGPIIFVAHDLIESFGWSAQSAAGIVVMLAIYAVIVAALRFTVARRAPAPRAESKSLHRVAAAS